jgi:hypothetical protein
MIDLVNFIDQGWKDQQKYDNASNRLGPIELNDPQFTQQRYEKIVEYLGHLIEEAVEARMLIPRRSWKKHEVSYLDSPEKRVEFISEMFDILLFLRAVLAYAGVDGKEFEKVAQEKYQFNLRREDHNGNSGIPNPKNPGI